MCKIHPWMYGTELSTRPNRLRVPDSRLMLAINEDAGSQRRMNSMITLPVTSDGN